MCLSWDYYTETGHFPATRMIELFETPDALRAIDMQIKLYRHSKSSGACSFFGSAVVVVNTGIAEVTRLLI